MVKKVINMKLKELLCNKKVVFYGDSITHNWEKYDHFMNLTHKDDVNYKYNLGYGYVKKLNDACNFKSVDNFAVSGGCYANCYKINALRQSFRHFPYQVTHSTNKLKDADIVFVMFGTNDYSEQLPFKDYKDVAKNEYQGDMSFFEGMNFGFKKIKETNPNAIIFVLNILNRTYKYEREPFNYSIDEYNLAIRQICEVYNLNLIDVSKLFDKENFKGGNKELYSDDGLHPNEKGYEALTSYILNYDIR